MDKLKVALLVNPFAGIGGEAGLKGSDGAAIRQQALDYNEQRRVDERLQVFLHTLSDVIDHIDWYAAAGAMGADHLLKSDIEPVLVVGDYPQISHSEHTVDAVKQLQAHDIDVLVFAGGDGTARNIVDALAGVNETLPCLGIPCGVKMQSGVFALSPYAAAQVLMSLINTDLTHIGPQDVRDIDEEALRHGRVRSQFYGSLSVPAEPRYMQNLKQGGIELEDWVLDDIAEQLTEIMQDEKKLMLVGPGNTTAHWLSSLNLNSTLVGFDAVRDGKLLANDLNGQDIRALLVENPDLVLVLSPTGRQGMLLGRGNQQLSPEVLRLIERSQLIVVAPKAKIKALNNRPLVVDCNDIELDKKFCGLYSIVTAYNDRVLYPVNNSYQELP